MKPLLLFSFSMLLLSCGTNTKAPKPCTATTQQEKFGCFLDSLSGATDLERVNAIRRYLAHRLDTGDDKKTVESPFDALQGFADNTLMARCTFASGILVGLLKHAGYKAYVYYCGFESDPAGNHHFVLVDLNGQLIVQDPFYNATFNHDFLALLDLMKVGQYDQVQPVEEQTVNELWYNQAQFDSAALLYGNSFGKVLSTDTVNGRIRMLFQHNYSSFTNTQRDLIIPLLQADSLPVSFYSLFRKPVSVYDDEGVQSDSLLSVIRAHL